VATAGAVLPDAALMVWLDEPGLARFPLPLAREAVVSLVSESLAALGPRVVSGVHCCGSTDWRLAVEAGAGVLSMPVDLDGDVPDLSTTAATLDDHLRRGGWIAWGVVPTDRPVLPRDEDELWNKLLGRWAALATAGTDPDLLGRRALVTPACGLAGLDEQQATTVVELTRVIGRRVAQLAGGKDPGSAPILVPPSL
jgi:hypothetical protein